MKTVFLVDGSSLFLRYLEHIIKRLGYMTRSATSVRTGLENIRREAPDMVFCEASLPDGKGADLCRAIKGDPSTGGAHVVFLSTNGGDETREEALKSGCTTYLTKPVKTRKIFNILEKYIGHRRRQNIRTPYVVQVEVQTDGGKTEILESSNLGEGGMFLKTDTPLPLGSEMRLQFRLQGCPDPLSFTGEVVSSFNGGSESMLKGMGIKFAESGGRDQPVLSSFIESYVSGAHPA